MMTDAISELITGLAGAVAGVGRVNWSDPAITAQVISTLATVLSAFVAILALLYTACSFRKSVNNLHYTELDSMYLELLKMAVDKPHLRQPDGIYRNPLAKTSQEREYDIYARMIWNFLETIADRCHNDSTLKDTWYPVIRDEGTVHRQWIRKEPKGFSDAFYERFGPEGPLGDSFLNGAQEAKRVKCPLHRH